MAVFTEVNLAHQTVSAGTDTLYTVPGATKAIIKDIQISNTTNAAATITIWIDPNGTSATDAEVFLKGFSVPANDFIHWSGFIVIEAASTIKATSGTAGAIAVNINGATIV